MNDTMVRKNSIINFFFHDSDDPLFISVTFLPISVEIETALWGDKWNFVMYTIATIATSFARVWPRTAIILKVILWDL